MEDLKEVGARVVISCHCADRVAKEVLASAYRALSRDPQLKTSVQTSQETLVVSDSLQEVSR